MAALEVSSDVEVWPVDVAAVEVVAEELEPVEVDVCAVDEVALVVALEEECAVDA